MPFESCVESIVAAGLVCEKRFKSGIVDKMGRVRIKGYRWPGFTRWEIGISSLLAVETSFQHL